MLCNFVKKYTLNKYLPKIIGTSINILSYIWPTKAGDIALDVFGKPRKGKLREKDINYLNEFTIQTITKNGLNFPLYTKGTGALKILLLHGWESNAARWRQLNKALEKELDCTIYMIDAPAHGGSDGTDFSSIGYAYFINEVCNKINPDVIIGHSIGAGSIAYCHSQLEPLQAAKLVLMGSPDTFTEIMDTYVNIIGLNKNGQAAMIKAIYRKYTLQPSDYAISKYALKIHNNTLVLHDTKDMISVVDNGKKIAANLKNGQLVITDGYGHGMQHPFVFEKVVSFLKND
jgi:pimeloyl-ACP methyl ester carboxylesterase